MFYFPPFVRVIEYVAAVPLPDKSARSIVNAIMTNWISLYGAPATIRMDQGKEFDNNLLKNLLNALDVNIKLGFSHNHQSNPIERFHRTLWALLKAKKANGENDWEKSLPTLILAYNATQHFSTNSSPARIFLGRELNLPHLSLLPNMSRSTGLSSARPLTRSSSRNRAPTSPSLTNR